MPPPMSSANSCRPANGRPSRARVFWLVALAACCVWLGALRGATALIHHHDGVATHLHLLPAGRTHAEAHGREARGTCHGEQLHACAPAHEEEGLHLRVSVPMFELARGTLVPRLPQLQLSASDCPRMCFQHGQAAKCNPGSEADPPPRARAGGVRGLLLTSRAVLV